MLLNVLLFVNCTENEEILNGKLYFPMEIVQREISET